MTMITGQDGKHKVDVRKFGSDRRVLVEALITGTIPGGGSITDPTKQRLLCAEDLTKDFVWVDVDGVRRVSIIEFTSSVLDAELSAIVKLTRTFSYQASDPFDLTKVEDVLDVT